MSQTKTAFARWTLRKATVIFSNMQSRNNKMTSNKTSHHYFQSICIAYKVDALVPQHSRKALDQYTNTIYLHQNPTDAQLKEEEPTRTLNKNGQEVEKLLGRMTKYNTNITGLNSYFTEKDQNLKL
eukprot:15365059-Ditylum_brightwellii.AAC.2